MPTPSKFTKENRERVLQALQIGAHRTTAAQMAGLDEATLRRWVTRGKDAAEGTRYREFYEDVLKAEASPRMRALGIVYREMPERPDLAWRFIERREPGYAPPVVGMPPVQAPVVINLSFADGRPVPALEGDYVELAPEPELPEATDPATA